MGNGITRFACLGRCTLILLPLLLASCATFRREPVAEIEPPPVLTAVPVRLPSAFTANCRYRPHSGSVESIQVELEDKALRGLHEHQELAIRSTDAFLTESTRAFDHIAQVWLSAHTALNTDTQAAWRRATDQAYSTIVSRVLDTSQRKRHEKLRRRNLSREDLWSRIAVTAEQRMRMQRIYEEALAEAQPAWAVARAFTAQAHGNLDSVLPALEAKRLELRVLADAVEAVLAEAAEADRKYRDAERQEQWLKAKLEASRDDIEQIRISKEIADLRTDAELLRIASREQSEMVGAFEWRGQHLRNLEAELAKRIASGQGTHTAHIAMLKEVSGWAGRRAAPNDSMYRRFGTMLQDSMQRIAATPDGFSESTVNDIKRRLGGHR